MSDLKIKGKITTVLEVESGTSKAGKEWKKQSFVIDTGDQFNPLVCFSLFGEEKIKLLLQFGVGENIEVGFNVSSREFSGKYYHNLDAWKLNKAESKPVAVPVSADLNSSDSNDGLPY